MAGDPLNHSQLLTQEQMDRLRDVVGIDADDAWAALRVRTRRGGSSAREAARLAAEQPHQRRRRSIRRHSRPRSTRRNPHVTSTQEALGRTLARLADFAGSSKTRIVTLSPDVATSTHLSGWINKVGVFSPAAARTITRRRPSGCCKWQPSPSGQHIELGISEMNLFMALGQFGLSARADRPAPDPDRHGLRSVRLPRVSTR